MINVFTDEELQDLGYISKDDAREAIRQADMVGFQMGRRFQDRKLPLWDALIGFVCGAICTGLLWWIQTH